jgi:hypothetical protein
MGIFSRRRTPVITATWQPDGSEPAIAPGFEMNDDGCESEEAYGVTFLLASAPGSWLTIWTYVAPAGPAALHAFELGHRYEYRTASWTASLYGPAQAGGFGDLASADEAAQLTAIALSVSPRDGGPDEHAMHFDWDGAPW